MFLLERLEVLKSQEARFKLSEDPQISELVISYAKLTAFGVEVFRECAGPPVGKKNRQRRKKRS